MEKLQSARALQPVETEPGVHVHPAEDQRPAAQAWLLSTLPEHKQDRARKQWTDHKVALLPLGELFSAVRMPASLVLAVTGGRTPSTEVDQVLAELLDGGPVICDPRRWYYALVPASMPRTWHQAAAEWLAQEVDCLGRDSYLGVPRLDVTRHDPTTHSYWSVPMSSVASLCSPLSVARLIAAGYHELANKAGTDTEDGR